MEIYRINYRMKKHDALDVQLFHKHNIRDDHNNHKKGRHHMMKDIMKDTDINNHNSNNHNINNHNINDHNIRNKEELEQLGERAVSSEDIFDGFILHVKKDTVALPNGNTATREIIRHIGAVCVVPLTKDNKVIMERQFRYPIDSVITEIPAGKLDSRDEDRLSAIKRELREETGYIADDWLNMGVYYPAPAYSDEKIDMYLARGLHKGERELDEDEFLNIYEIPIEALVSDIMSGRITDGKTQVAVLKAAKILGVL